MSIPLSTCLLADGSQLGFLRLEFERPPDELRASARCCRRRRRRRVGSRFNRALIWPPHSSLSFFAARPSHCRGPRRALYLGPPISPLARCSTASASERARDFLAPAASLPGLDARARKPELPSGVEQILSLLMIARARLRRPPAEKWSSIFSSDSCKFPSCAALCFLSLWKLSPETLPASEPIDRITGRRSFPTDAPTGAHEGSQLLSRSVAARLFRSPRNRFSPRFSSN